MNGVKFKIRKYIKSTRSYISLVNSTIIRLSFVPLNAKAFKISSLILLLCLTAVNTHAQSQNHRLDSLNTILKKPGASLEKANTLIEMVYEYIYANPDTSIFFSLQAIDMANDLLARAPQKSGKKHGHIQKCLANAYIALGGGYHVKGEYPKALETHLKALALNKKIKNKKGCAACYGNLALVYNQQGDFAESLHYYFKAMKTYEELKDKYGMAVQYVNIGSLYNVQGNHSKALDYFYRSLEIIKAMKNAYGVSTINGNLGLAYMNRADAKKPGDPTLESDYDTSLYYYNEALRMDEALGNTNSVGLHLANIGNIYLSKGQHNKENDPANPQLYKKALEYIFKGLEISSATGDKNEQIRQLGAIGTIYIITGKYADGEKYLLRSLALAEEIGAKDAQREEHKNLSQFYELRSKPELALKHYKKYIAMRDSLNSAEAVKKQAQTEMQYEFDKKQTADSIQTAERAKQEKLKHTQEIAQQRMYTYFGIALFVIMLIVALISFRAYRNKQKANYVIAQQKELVEEKQKEILDSIHYAKRIQQALLPSEKYIQRKLKRS